MRPLDHGAGVVYGVIGAVSGGTASLARVFESSCCFKKSAKKLWPFNGQRGFLSHPAGTGRRWTNPGQGHYYLAMPKVSRVRCASTRAPYSGRSAYAVSPEWVTSALQADKISLAAAKQEYVRCARSLHRNLQHLERISLERQRLSTDGCGRQASCRKDGAPRKVLRSRRRVVGAWPSLSASLQILGY